MERVKFPQVRCGSAWFLEVYRYMLLILEITVGTKINSTGLSTTIYT
jgi:hypothetical protein